MRRHFRFTAGGCEAETAPSIVFRGAPTPGIRVIVARLSAKPWIRGESGSFMGRFGDQAYALGSTEAGLAQAIRRMSRLRRERQVEVA
jgi:hypothetical protein